MSKTLTGLFDTEEHAARARRALLRGGIPPEEIAVIPVMAASLELDGATQRRTRARAVLLRGGIGMLAGALLAVVGLRVDTLNALEGALIGAVLGVALGLSAAMERRAARGSALVAVRTADSKLARVAKRTLSREALDYTFEGTTVAR
jgi:hypothetical protein